METNQHPSCEKSLKRGENKLPTVFRAQNSQRSGLAKAACLIHDVFMPTVVVTKNLIAVMLRKSHLATLDVAMIATTRFGD